MKFSAFWLRSCAKITRSCNDYEGFTRRTRPGTATFCVVLILRCPEDRQEEELPPTMSSFIFDRQTAIVPFPVTFPLLCKTCNRSIKEATFKRYVFRHSRTCRQRDPDSPEANELVFECTLCKCLSSDRRKATTHQASHFGDKNYSPPQYPCGQCNRFFATQKALSSHLRQCKNMPVAQTVDSVQSPTTPLIQSGVLPASDVETHAQATPSSHSPPPPQNASDEVPFNEKIIGENSSFVTIDDVEDDEYKVLADDIQMHNCDEWLRKLLPPKERSKYQHQQHVPNARYGNNSKMSAKDLQQLYSKDMKKAMKKIQFTPEIHCEVDSVDLRFGLLTQLSSSEKELDVKDLWQPCYEGRSELSRRFSQDEFDAALQHKSSAAGPDGWTYNDVRKVRNFSADFVKGVHWMATNGATPECWKDFNSMMLFKKPDDFQPGQERVLKNFRPIALSNVTYKTLASAMCKRLTKWLAENKGISYSQRAVFGRHGVSENTLIVGEALRAQKSVIYLDLSDAFNSVEHNVIFEALRQCRCPEWITRLIKSMYSGCKTTPTDVNGRVLAGPVPVTRGVKQGCPLSALLFNLVLDPILRAGTSNASMCLGYMDDLAIVIEDKTQTEGILQKVVEMTTRLGLSFNAGKCGVANFERPLEIEGVPIPAVTVDRAYRYLGTEVLPTKVEGLEDCFKKTWRVAELIEFSELTPMQKLHALRVKVYPMLYHLLENSQTTVKQLERMNRDLLQMTKRLLFLPERAACAYLHLHRMYGGPGIPNLMLTKSKLDLKTVVTMLNLDGEFGEYCKDLICAAHSRDSIITRINENRTAGCSNTVKDAARALRKLNQYLEVPLNLALCEDQMTLSTDGTTYKDLWPTLNRVLQKQSLKDLQKLPNQGRFWKTLSATPFGTKNIYNFHTKLCDWRQVHKARLNLIPVVDINAYDATSSDFTLKYSYFQPHT